VSITVRRKPYDSKYAAIRPLSCSGHHRAQDAVDAGEMILTQRHNLKEPGYVVRPLPEGDFIVRVRHVTANQLSLRGE